MNLRKDTQRNFEREEIREEAKKRDLTNKRPLMNLNRFMSDRKNYSRLYACFAGIIFILSVFVLNKLDNFSFSEMLDDGMMHTHESFAETVFGHMGLLVVLVLVLGAGYIKFAYDIRTSFGTLNVGQKGTASWVTREELDRQYVKVHQNNELAEKEEIKGYGGIPVARDGDYIYIDNTNVNNLIIGTTRSGKGQIILEPMCEILSRAEKKCSMVITDPKMELANKMIPELKRRGYDTYLLNLVDNRYSCGYNPLTLIVREYKEGNEAAAQQLCSSLAHNVFVANPQEKDPFWTNQARNVFIASIMADIEDNIKKDRKLNQRWKHEHDRKEDAAEEAFYRNTYKEEGEYDRFLVYRFLKGKLEKQGDLSIESLFTMYEEEKMKGNLPSIPGFTEPGLKTLLTEGKEKYKARYRRKEYFPVNDNEKKINIYSILVMTNALASIKTRGGHTALDDYFDLREEDNFARVTYGSIISSSEQTKGTIMSTFRSRLTVFFKEDIAKMTMENSIDFDKVGVGKRPTAIFLALPDYDESNWFIATVFINQLYYVLAKLATALPSNELPRRVCFILDEFGNMPPLDNIGNIFTVCLGRNITFTIAVQSFSQINGKYDETTYNTIKGNCGNQVYIMTGEGQTAKTISEDLGNETITTVNRSGKKLSLHKEQTEMVEQRELMTAEELMHMEMGETIVLRFMYRQTKDKKEMIKAKPIANLGENRMRYAYKFLSNIFPGKQILYRGPELERIIEENPDMDLGQFKVEEGMILTTDHIRIKERLRSADEYIKEKDFREKDFPFSKEENGQSYIVKNEVQNLMNMRQDQIERYQNEYDEKRAAIAAAKAENKSTRKVFSTLTNAKILNHADKLIASGTPSYQDRGFRLYDILQPISPKPTSQEEIAEEDSVIEQIMYHSDLIMEFQDEAFDMGMD